MRERDRVRLRALRLLRPGRLLRQLEAEPGDTAEKELDLEPGKYVMIRNLPGHYEQGMHGSVTVE